MLRSSASLLILILALTWAGVARAQDPGMQQPSPRDDNTEPPSQSGAQRNSDPFLQYQENVELRISQIEIGDFPVVRTFVSAVDQSGVPIRTLTPQDFVVTENGQPVGELRFANREELDLPLSVMFVVDVSGSMMGLDREAVKTPMDLEVEAIRDFVNQLNVLDRVGLVIFSDAAYSVVDLTSDHSMLLRELDNLTAWGQTTLWDGIKVGIEDLVDDTVPSRKAMIVLSDGIDTGSLETLQTVMTVYEAEAMVKNKGFSIYTLALGDEVNRSALQQLAKKTGGLHFDSPGADDLSDVYQSILRQIQNEYLLEYDSTLEIQVGQITDIKVTLNNVRSTIPAEYTYRSPGLAAALRNTLIPGLIVIGIALILLVIATIYKISRRVWVTLQITPLEGKDYVIGIDGLEIGTSELCRLRVAGDPGMLSMHASIRETSDGYLLEATDANSPILFGGALLARKLLRNGDAFMLGTSSFVFTEKELREGEGRMEDARYFQEEELGQITEADMLSLQGPGAASRNAGARPTALLASSGPYSGERFELANGENRIGRSEGTLVLDKDAQLSRRHCVITLTTDAATILDYGSSNGTSVGSQRLQPGMAMPVRSGDEIAIGSSRFRLE